MEFGTISASIEPIGYEEVRKTTRFGKKRRSAVEQFEIHCIAHEFPSTLLRVPTPYRVESPRSYVMEHIRECIRIPSSVVHQIYDLHSELLRFKQWMIARGFFPLFFSVLRCESHYILVDFSRFGVIDRGRVHVPGFSFKFTLPFIELYYNVKHGGRPQADVLDMLTDMNPEA